VQAAQLFDHWHGLGVAGLPGFLLFQMIIEVPAFFAILLLEVCPWQLCYLSGELRVVKLIVGFGEAEL
jgi:hypothetical protein